MPGQACLPLILWLMVVCLPSVGAEVSQQDLSAEIISTQQLLLLYRQKLQLLQQMHRQFYPRLPLPEQPKGILSPSSNSSHPSRVSQHLILLKQLQGRCHYLPPGYLLQENTIISADSYLPISEFLGRVLVKEEGRVTSLVGGQLGMTEVRGEAFLMGRTGQALASLWHRRLNIKDGEDILLQWEASTLYFRSKDAQEVSFPDETILGVFVINQFKVVVVTTAQVVTVNSRSLQRGDSLRVGNLSRTPLSGQQVVAGCQAENGVVLVLLSSGELAHVINERVVAVQVLQRERDELALEPTTTQMQALQQTLLVMDRAQRLMRVFRADGNRYSLLLALPLPALPFALKNIDPSQAESEGQWPEYVLFLRGQSTRLLISGASSSVLYELLLPQPAEPGYSSSYFKMGGVVLVVLTFIYFKLVRKEEPTQGPGLREEGVRRRREGGGRADKRPS